MKHSVTPILIDLLLAIVLLVVIMGSFMITSCSSVNAIEKPPVAWQAATTITVNNTTTTANVDGSLDAGIIQSDLSVEFVMIDNIPLLFSETLNLCAFYSIFIQQTWICDLVEDTCSLCISAPSIWPLEICF